MMHTDIWRAIDILAQQQVKPNTGHTNGTDTPAREAAAQPKKGKK